MQNILAISIYNLTKSVNFPKEMKLAQNLLSIYDKNSIGREVASYDFTHV